MHNNGIYKNEYSTSQLAKAYSIHTADSLTLYDDGLHGDGAANDGLYSNYYINTSIDGSYTFNITAEGSTNDAGNFRRENSFSTVVQLTDRPVVVSLISLPNGINGVMGNPTLKWNEVLNATMYEIQVSYLLPSSQSTTNVTIIDSLVNSDSLTLNNLIPGKTYSWRVRAFNYANLYSDWSEQWNFTMGYNPENENICYPNPFNPDLESLRFRFNIENSGNVSIKIYDVSNHLVKELLSNKQYNTGVWEDVYWDGLDDNNQIVANGVYFYVIESSSGERAVGKIAVLK